MKIHVSLIAFGNCGSYHQNSVFKLSNLKHSSDILVTHHFGLPIEIYHIQIYLCIQYVCCKDLSNRIFSNEKLFIVNSIIVNMFDSENSELNEIQIAYSQFLES